MIVDLPGHRLRTFPWQLWRKDTSKPNSTTKLFPGTMDLSELSSPVITGTNYAYNVSRHMGLQGSLSWYSCLLWATHVVLFN